MTLGVVGYAALGFACELLVTGYYRCVSRGRALPASGLSALTTLFGFWILDRLLGAGLSWPDAVAYAVGNGAGCLLIMSIRRR